MKTILKSPLTLLSLLWEYAYALRRFKFMLKNSDSESIAAPVISVGNIAFGGTGKTPFIIWLANHLKNSSKNIIIATRGYRSQMEKIGGMMTFPNKDPYSAKIYGDEPVLIGENIKEGRIIVGRSRFENLRRFLSDDEKNSIVLLDDGFQHLKLNRDLNIVLFDAALDLDRYYCPPRGYLREGMGSLKDADLIAIGRVDLVPPKQVEKLELMLQKHTKAGTPFAHFTYKGECLINSQGKSIPPESYKWFAFCGIASPSSFLESLMDMGCEIVEHKTFPDHFNYTLDHLNDLNKESRKLGAKLVCTEKDAVKLKEIDPSIEVYYLKIVVQITHGEHEVKNILQRVISH